MDPTYANKLRELITNPGSYTATPGYQFALDQGINAAQRSSSAAGLRYSGNALADLVKLGAGYASQDYGATVDRLGKLSGQEQQYDLGQGANANTAEANRLAGIRDANALTLGEGANANTAQRNANDLTLGEGQLDLGRHTADQTYDLGMSRTAADYDLGVRGADNAATATRYNYDLGKERNSIDASTAQNNFHLASDRNGIDWYNARTGRGDAQSRAYLGDQTNQRAWYSIYPRRVIAGQA